MRGLVVALVLVGAVAPARADSAGSEPWYRGRYGHNRVLHGTITLAGGSIFVLSEVFKADFAASSCRWCAPDSIDTSVRDALVWHDTGRANLISNISGYGLAPAATLGLILVSSLSRDDASTAQVIDDALPVVETAVLTELVVQSIKFSGGRQRPFVHFGLNPPQDADNNVSFLSAHTALCVGLTTSAGLIAHARGYAVEPYIWGFGSAIAIGTGYLRIAADKHYFTDVIAGAALGMLGGLTVPLLTKRARVELVPQANGVAVVGMW